MAKEIITEPVTVPVQVVADKIAVDAITINCVQQEAVTVQFAQYAYPVVDGVVRPEKKRFIGTMKVELKTPESLMQHVTIKSPIDQESKSLTFAEIAEFIAQYWVDQYEASLIPVTPA